MAKAKVSVDSEVSVDAESVDDQWFNGALLTGMDVYWYRGASAHAEPRPAKVMRGYDGGQCDLIVFLGDGTQSYVGVYHKSNPGLNENGVPTDNARRYGAWDFAPWSKEYYDSRIR